MTWRSGWGPADAERLYWTHNQHSHSPTHMDFKKKNNVAACEPAF